MTLQEFRTFTDQMPGNTLIGLLEPWGEISPAAIAHRDELAEDDPVRDLITTNIILITTAEPTAE